MNFKRLHQLNYIYTFIVIFNWKYFTRTTQSNIKPGFLAPIYREQWQLAAAWWLCQLIRSVLLNAPFCLQSQWARNHKLILILQRQIKSQASSLRCSCRKNWDRKQKWKYLQITSILASHNCSLIVLLINSLNAQ